MDNIEILWTPEETSRVTRTTEATLAKWRVEKRNGRKRVPLPFVKMGGKILYRKSDVEAFIVSRTVTPGQPKPRRAAAK
jgi:hypothetical protein